MSKIDQALQSARETKALVIGSGVLSQVGEMFKRQFGCASAVIVADKTTYEVAGRRVEVALRALNIEVQPTFIFTDDDLYAEYTFVEQLAASLKTHDATPIAVGSGTINDLTKLASHLCGRHYMCVATAASMDGYTAFGASITANGAKQTFNCPAPQACLADIDIISKAPAAMTASGYADLFAKITAGLDWILAEAMGIEEIDPVAWAIVQDGLHDALGNPQGVRDGDPKAISELIQGLMLGGFAMQRSMSSRPASGAEHQFSHLWNMEHHLNNGKHISHGFQVAIGTLAITALYEVILGTALDKLNIESAVSGWPTIDRLHDEAICMFQGTDFPEIGAEEVEAKYTDKEELAKQLGLLKSNWPQISARLRKQMVSFDEARRSLAMVGAPTSPEEIGISREYLYETFIRSQFIRRRFTVLDVAVRTGMQKQWLDKLFGKGGIWEIEQHKIIKTA